MNYHLSQIGGVTSPSTAFGNYETLPADVTTRFLLFTTAAAGTYFFIRIILSGYSFLTSSGDPGKIQEAQNQILNSALGLLVVICAYFVVQIMQLLLGLNIL